MERKYELTNETLTVNGTTLHGIRALRSFGDVKKWDSGGFIEKEENLSHEGDCWVYDDAVVYGGAKVCDDAEIYDNVIVRDNSIICGSSKLYNSILITGNSKIDGCTMVGRTMVGRVCGGSVSLNNVKNKENAEDASHDNKKDTLLNELDDVVSEEAKDSEESFNNDAKTIDPNCDDLEHEYIARGTGTIKVTMCAKNTSRKENKPKTRVRDIIDKRIRRKNKG